MEQKSFVLVNGGMNRDLSVSKAGKSSVFENRNVRIESSDNDTFLSITNERGTKRVDGISFTGTLIGWNTLGNYLILFFYNTAQIQGRVVEMSSIYRVEYDGENFKSVTIFTGPLGFSPLHPIESIVDYEMESIQKIYWVDGKNVLRFLNFSDEYLTAHLASGTLDDDPVFDFAEDISWFDSTRPSLVLPTCVISKSNTSANPRPDGTAQYFLTYYNRHGQQTGIIYSSPVVYLSPTDRGGAADETNNNAIRLEFSGLDPSYERVRLYQIVRTTADVVSYAYLVAEKTVSDGAAVFIDDGTNLGTVDASSFLYLGSVGVIAETMAHKDGVLFLGNVSSLGNDNTDDLDAIIKQNAFDLSGYIFQDGTDWESKIVEFFLTSETATDAEDCNIPNVYASGYYPYINQLSYTKAQISSFKGGEKYRFALKFFNADGTSSKAFWIGDKVNPYYPLMLRNASVSRPLARCFVPQAIIDQAKANGFVSVQLQVAQATNSDRSVLAQGIVSPAMFNLYERYKKEVFAQSSWIYRPKRSLIPHTHFSGLENPYSRYAELQCAWSSNDFIPTPLYSEDVNGALDPTPEGSDGRNYVTMIGTIKYTGSFGSKYSVTLTIRYYSDSSGSTQTAFYQGNSNGYKSIDYCVDVWEKAYKESAFPYEYRLSNSQIKSLIFTATPSQPTVNYTLSDGPKQVSNNSIDNDLIFSLYNRQHYFVDESIVTFNSPEIDNFEVNTDRNDGLKFRIVGVSGVVGNISDYVIDATTPKLASAKAEELDFSRPVVSSDAYGLSAWPLYKEEIGNVGSDVGDVMLYMWNKAGSIPSYTDDNTGTEYSILKKKVFANLRFGFYTAYNNYRQNEWSVSPEDLRQINDISVRLYELIVGGNKTMYSSGADQLVQMPENVEYPLLFSKSVPDVTDTLDLTKARDVSTPVQISYTSRPHAVISLGNHILPYLSGEDEPDYPGEYAPWKNTSLDEYSLIYREVDFSDESKVADNEVGAFGTFDILNDDGIRGTLRVQGDDLSDFCDYMLTVQEELSERAEGRDVYAHIKVDYGSNTSCWLMNLNDFTVGRVKVHARLVPSNVIMPIDLWVDSPYPIRSVLWTITDENQDQVFSATLTQDTIPSLTEGKCHTYTYYVGDPTAVYTLSYSIIFDVDTYDSVPLVPTIENGSFSLGGQNYTAKAVHDLCVTTSDAPYREIDELSDNTIFIDIVNGSNAILKYESRNGFVYDGMLTSQYQRPESVEYILPSGNLVGDAQGLLIGELYRDYDEESEADISLDTRYGGVDSSAVESNIFIPAGPRKQLSDTETADSYMSALLEMQDLYDDCVDNHSTINRLIAVWLSLENMLLYREIDLSSINNLDPSDMTLHEFARIVADSINAGDAGITATVDRKGNVSVVIDEDCEDEYTEISVRKYRRQVGGSNNWQTAVVEAEFEEVATSVRLTLLGNEGDTYFQRYDSLKTLPGALNEQNQVVEIASVMLESHINLDGRTDKYRGLSKIASFDWGQFGALNKAYTQNDNFISSREMSDTYNLGKYPSSIIWTLPKAAGAEIDEWTHITLGSALALDGDRGECRAVRRFRDSIISFQDKGVAEILFNSSTPLSTDSGMPVELANSGKVEGKRYISGLHGCVNKWSITEGKNGLYFIDDINKSFNVLASGERSRIGITDLSAGSGFSAWFRKRCTLDVWTPSSNRFDNFVSFYDRSRSDIYLVGKASDTEAGTLVYNEDMGAFTSFYDYEKVPMMASIRDKFVSYRDGNLWLMHEGLFDTFFDNEYPSSVTYRVTPEPYNDKIWTNIDYRGDFFTAFDENDNYLLPEGVSVNHLAEVANDLFMAEEKIGSIKVWDEYQQTAEDVDPALDKTFRIWRYQIPRALDADGNATMDRIRNPWIYVRFKKLATDMLMNIHDIVVRYFE